MHDNFPAFALHRLSGRVTMSATTAPTTETSSYKLNIIPTNFLF
jgi:hypothetical protein